MTQAVTHMAMTYSADTTICGASIRHTSSEVEWEFPEYYMGLGQLAPGITWCPKCADRAPLAALANVEL